MPALLVPLDGGKPIEIAQSVVLVGRTEECDVRLKDVSVSGLHCVIATAESCSQPAHQLSERHLAHDPAPAGKVG
jgi:hypothetical protein